MNTSNLSSNTCLMLHAGQLAFHNEETRALALALACLTDEQDGIGATGTGSMPQIADLMILAQEFIAVTLDEHTVLRSLDCLATNSFLTAPVHDIRTPYQIDTTTIPTRITSDDCGEADYSLDVESGTFDAYGFGDH